MNQLSWLLYFSDIATKLVNTCAPFAIISGFVISMWYLFYLFDKKIGFPSFYLISFFCINLIIVILIPSQNTMYMIAASQASQSVVSSPQGQKLINDVGNKISSYLEKDSK